MTKPLPSLENLRSSRQAAWLWDTARNRLVWANAAGVAALGVTSLFELIDQPFDSSEPALVTMKQSQESLQRGSSAAVELSFPALGLKQPFSCDCCLHALADGRDGLLAVLRPTASLPILEEAGLFEDLPSALCALAEDGQILFANAMARALFDARAIANLAQLLLPQGQAETLLQRLQESKLVSAISAYQSPYGQRQLRLTLRKPQQSANVFALAAMEDVTDRLELERNFGPPETPTGKNLGATEQQVFENLGKALNKATNSEPVSAPLADREEAAHPRRGLAAKEKPPAMPDLPFALAEGLERSAAAIAIVQDGKAKAINGKLLALLGLSNRALMQRLDFWETLQRSKTSRGSVVVAVPGGGITLDYTRRAMPWQNGKADQYVFETASAAMGDGDDQGFNDSHERAQAPSIPTNHQAVPPREVALPKTPLPNPLVVPASASEQELRSILDISSDGIVTLDASGVIKNFSAGAEAIFGYRSAELLDKPFATLLNTESVAAFNEYLAGLDGQGLASVFNDGREITGVVKQGGTTPLFMNMGRLNTADGRTLYCAVLRDITAFKRTELELREATQAAVTASQHKSDFLARVSHELRTPLNAIMGFSEIMRNGRSGDLPNEKYRGYINDIHASGAHLLSMINELLDLSRIESGRMELNFTSVNLVDCFDSAARLLQEQATRGRVLLRKSFPDKLPRVVADLRSMRQIMLNILSNAIKYTDPGGQVIVSAKAETNGALLLRLQDTGIGMKQEDVQRALLPFMRIETPGRGREGSGLGLPLTKALVEANRAGFAIASEVGKGTTVEITFPTTRVLVE